MTGTFILQIKGITEGIIANRPSKYNGNTDTSISDVIAVKGRTHMLAYTPTTLGDKMAEFGSNVLVAYCPENSNDSSSSSNLNIEDHNSHNSCTCRYTHTVFLSVIKDKITDPDDKAQIVCVNPKVAYELVESIIEKNIISVLPPVKQFKRFVPMVLDGKVDSCFSFVGVCEDDVPFIIEVNNVSAAEFDYNETPKEETTTEKKEVIDIELNPQSGSNSLYNYHDPVAQSEIEKINKQRKKTAFFPDRHSKNVKELIKRIKDLTTIRKESIIRCMLCYVIERTDIDCLEFSMDDADYRLAVKEAIQAGVDIVPVMVRWNKEGIAVFLTEEIPVVFPHD